MKIILITDYRKFLRQGIKQYLSMDKEKINKILLDNNLDVVEYTYEEIINNKIRFNNEIIIYTSSQNLDYKHYIDDILYGLSKRNDLIPRYDIFRAHENKGYQELLKEELGIRSLKYFYFGNKLGLENNANIVDTYPLILKRIFGAGSSNVYKIDSYKDLKNSLKKLNMPDQYKGKVIKRVIQKNIMKSKYIPEFHGEDSFMGAFVLQEFMDGLKEDWKVLVFGEKYYVLNRKVADNDFKASGSGKLAFIDPPKEVLEYARFIYEKLDVPFVSLDIGFNGTECGLIEFQGVHFGPYTLMKSEGYFEHVNGDWENRKGKSVLEEEYAYSILEYLKRKNY